MVVTYTLAAVPATLALQTQSKADVHAPSTQQKHFCYQMHIGSELRTPWTRAAPSSGLIAHSQDQGSRREAMLGAALSLRAPVPPACGIKKRSASRLGSARVKCAIYPCILLKPSRHPRSPGPPLDMTPMAGADQGILARGRYQEPWTPRQGVQQQGVPLAPARRRPDGPATRPLNPLRPPCRSMTGDGDETQHATPPVAALTLINGPLRGAAAWSGLARRRALALPGARNRCSRHSGRAVGASNTAQGSHPRKSLLGEHGAAALIPQPLHLPLLPFDPMLMRSAAHSCAPRACSGCACRNPPSARRICKVMRCGARRARRTALAYAVGRRALAAAPRWLPGLAPGGARRLLARRVRAPLRCSPVPKPGESACGALTRPT
jgi:hypothetical protein